MVRVVGVWFVAASACLIAGCANGGVERRMTGDAGPRDVAPAVDVAASVDSSVDSSVDAWAGDPCSVGATRFCMTTCMTTGIASCTAMGVFGACVPPNEDCNGRDDDCDGLIDEMIARRMCSSACGGGTESCVAGHWTGCTATMPMPEICNGLDDDCDGLIDEMLTRTCASACGSGNETCASGRWVACTARQPVTEICNGLDDDCDGLIDEGLTRACANACGTGGTQTCTAGTYAACNAPPPPIEVCNGLDDDCDAVIDEDLQLTIYDGTPTSMVTSFQAACTGPGGALDVCLTAAKRWCVNRGCSIGGAGLLSGNGSTVRVACFGNHASERSVTFATLAAAYGNPAFDESMASSRVASSYANRWCQSQGFAAGVGPVEHASGMMVVDCLAADQAMYIGIMTSELSALSCDPLTAPDTFACNVAADAVCRNHGFRAGWGPVEWNTTNAGVVCFR